MGNITKTPSSRFQRQRSRSRSNNENSENRKRVALLKNMFQLEQNISKKIMQALVKFNSDKNKNKLINTLRMILIVRSITNENINQILSS